MQATSENKVPPVKVGEEYNLPIAGVGKSGDPFVKVESYVLFLKAAKGETLKLNPQQAINVRILKVLPKFGIAEVIQ